MRVFENSKKKTKKVKKKIESVIFLKREKCK